MVAVSRKEKLIRERGDDFMKIKKAARAFLGANLLLLLTFALLPALLFTPDVEIIQTVMNYINKD
jgi:hypothetical protein